MQSRTNRVAIASVLLAALILLAGCAPQWELGLVIDGQSARPIVAADVAQWAESFPDECNPDGGLLLERILWEHGVDSVEHLVLDDQSIPWAEAYDRCWLLSDGSLQLGTETLTPDNLSIERPAEMSLVGARINDIAPTVASALGVNPPEKSSGEVLTATTAKHVVYVFIDGLSYRRYMTVVEKGVMPFLQSLGTPIVGLSVFPSVTKVSSAAMLTGAMPQGSGVRDRSTRSTQTETILDVLTSAGRSSVAVEGDTLAFNMPNTDLILSGDRDGNGASDDNTFANAMRVVAEGIPDFLWVHWHGIDDVGHTFGPRSDEELAKMREIDGYVGDLIEALPPDTLVIIGADHGMHSEPEGQRLGNHGTLRPEDMFIPMWVIEPQR